MRPLLVQVSEGKGNEVLSAAKAAKAKNLCMWPGRDGDKKMDVILAFVSNRKVEAFIDDINKIEAVQVTLFPQGVMAMYPPQNQAPEQVTNVQARSPLEIFLSGLQSIGSWKGFLSYAALGAIVVWIGLFTNTVFLLVGAMLIAPFAGPAMKTAIATARGDARLLGRSLLRYAVSLTLTIVVTLLLSLLMQQEAATSLMVDRSQVSSTAILLALAAGCAGAISLVQSERSSLVSGAAAGMLVAASLAPPAGVIGMAITIGEWQMAKSAFFLLLLQLAGINLTGSLVFRAFGLTAKGPRYERGRKHIVFISLATTIICLGGLAWWQFSTQPALQRSSISKRAEEQIQKSVSQFQGASLVEGSARFTRGNIPGQNTLLCEVYVQAKQGIEHGTIKKELGALIHQAITKKLENVTPVLNVVVLDDLGTPGLSP
ncbi:MAG TPA: TIGR00341 family protein [Flavisolibacter sp.]